MNIFSPFQTHLDAFTLYIPPYLLCPATPRSKKSNKAVGEKKEKLNSAHRKVHMLGHCVHVDGFWGNLHRLTLKRDFN